MGSGKKQLSKNIAWLGLVQVANYVLPFISVPVISRIIGPERYGIIDFTASFMGYFGLLIAYGFDYTATRRVAPDPANEENTSKVFSEVFTSQIILFVFSSILVFILLHTLPEFANNKKVVMFTYLSCVAVLLTQNWIFQAMQDLQKIALFNFCTKIFFVTIILLVVKKPEDYVWQPLVINVIQILVAILSFFWAIKKYHIKLKLVSVKKSLLLLWNEKTVFFSLIVVNLYTTTNVVLLGFYRGKDEVAYFSSSQRLIVIAQSIIVLPLMQALYPFIGKAFAQSKENGLQVIQKIFPLITTICFIAALFMFFIGPFAIKLFYGPAFAPSVTVFKIMVFIPLLVAINYIMGIHIMLNLNMDKLYFKITAFGALISVGLNLLLLQKWSYVGSGAIWVITELLIAITMYTCLLFKGINAIRIMYWKPSVMLEYLLPITNKIFNRKTSV